MPRPSHPWFRFYVEALADRKLRRLKPEYRWLFVACLGGARQSPTPGVLLVAEGQPMDERDIADLAGMDVRSVRSGLKALAAAGLIVQGSEGDPDPIAYRSPTFQHRQFESDDVTKRTRKHRSTRADADEGTFQPRSEERSGNGDGNAPETETETDTTPQPPASGGHDGQHPNCRACGTTRRPRPPEPVRSLPPTSTPEGIADLEHPPIPRIDDATASIARAGLADVRAALQQPRPTRETA